MFVFQQELYCLARVKLEERDTLLSSESSYSDCVLELRMLPSCWENNVTTFFCYALLSVDFFVVVKTSLSVLNSPGLLMKGKIPRCF